MSFTPITNHIEQGLARLISQYSCVESVEGLVESFIQGFQSIENSAVEVCGSFDVFTSTGDQLDVIGTIVGVNRFEAEVDSEFRERVLATISLNTSSGTPEDAIRTFNFLRSTSLVLYREFFPGEVSLSSSSSFEDQHEVDLTLDIINSVLPAGVRINFIGVFDENEPFAFDGNLPGLGFGSISDANSGGFFSTIVSRNNFFAFGAIDQTREVDLKNEGFGTIQDRLIGGLFESA